MESYPNLSELLVEFCGDKSFRVNLIRGDASLNKRLYMFSSSILCSNSNFSLSFLSDKGECIFKEHYFSGDSLFLKHTKITKEPLVNEKLTTEPTTNKERSDKQLSEIVVIATMSSGKSTLINVLLRKELMPYENLACTAIIATITNSYEKKEKRLYGRDSNNNIIEERDSISFEQIKELNSNPSIRFVDFESRIHCLPSKKRIKLVDTPGTNSAQNPEHQVITYEKIKNLSNALIIYVLNAEQLATFDDKCLLQHVSENLRNNHIVFVLNKIDAIDAETERISQTLRSARNYVKSFGIKSPVIIPCCTRAALSIVNNEKFNYEFISKLPFIELKNQSRVDQKTYEYVHKFINNRNYFLENYIKQTKKEKRNSQAHLRRYKKNKDYKEIVLRHSGISFLEKEIKKHFC